ncbi:class I SAM-dependent methyltransferase [Bailinhaonella thermotolerans]|uniref:SAM-dependent methyltransferase n=1 Tax=Bailinhaonella thermotolerans TaxID=1070861 RepID=A0A3A4A9B4_9ACTN|nr:class I SAM-dependent methyltransferase [Bailinhaonella thermotolerans]RJL24711.1 SAM-dependent methyltransferase [Bailinhaonella thermotolerans]
MIENVSAITRGQRDVWAQGDLGRLAARFPPLYAELLCEELRLRPGERVLDAGAGTGTASVAAARRFCEVVAVDFVPESLERAALLAAGEGLPLATREADVQELPFPDGHFDAALSTFGVMFAPDQERAAAELLRAVRPGGRVGVTAWTPDGLIGRYARTVAAYVQPPPGLRSPFEWGTEARARELFAGARVEVRRRAQPFRYPSPAFAVDYFRDWYGPARAAFARLDRDRAEALRADMIAVWRAANESGDDTLVAHADYLEIVVTAP